MKTDVVSLLRSNGPALTSRLAELMHEKGVSAVAARQRVSRLPPNVKTLLGLPFPKRARFIYLEEQEGTDQYWTALVEAIENVSPAYSAALAGVQSRGGVLPRAHFDVASGSPILQKKQLSSATVLDRLVSVKLLERVHMEGYGECIALRDSESQPNLMRARLITEDVLMGAIRSWLGRMNFASPNATQMRGDTTPQFSTFNFDICGPSYVRPIRSFREAIRGGAQDTINSAGQQIIRRQLNVAPTLTIRPGFPVRVLVTKDLLMEPYPQK